MSVDTTLVSVDTALVSVDTALVSVDTSLVSVDTFLVSEDTNFFGRSKRFRAEDHLPVPLESAIQTFLCGGSRLPFGSGAIPFSGKPLSAASDPVKDAEVFRVRVLYFYLSGRYQGFPFGNEGQFAFVNPLRRI